MHTRTNNEANKKKLQWNGYIRELFLFFHICCCYCCCCIIFWILRTKHCLQFIRIWIQQENIVYNAYNSNTIYRTGIQFVSKVFAYIPFSSNLLSFYVRMYVESESCSPHMTSFHQYCNEYQQNCMENRILLCFHFPGQYMPITTIEDEKKYSTRAVRFITYTHILWTCFIYIT